MPRGRPAAELRETMRSARRAIRPDVASAAAGSAARLAIATAELRAASHVATYAAHDGELDPEPLDRLLADRGVTLWHPAVDGERLTWRRWHPGDATEPGEFGIPIPRGAAVDAPPLDAVIVPVVAVSRSGHRVGHGRGFYDRAFGSELADVPHRIGYAHDIQVVDDITPEPWDVAMHAVVTPTAVLDCRQDVTP